MIKFTAPNGDPVEVNPDAIATTCRTPKSMRYKRIRNTAARAGPRPFRITPWRTHIRPTANTT